MSTQRLDYGAQRLQEDYRRLDSLLVELRHIGITTGDTVKYIDLKMADAKRQLDNFFYKDKMNDDIYEFRYEAHGGEFKLKCWHDGKEDTMYGAFDTQPEWLTGIVDVAKIAGHLKTPISPPPEVILWFHTDKNRTLINFIELAP